MQEMEDAFLVEPTAVAHARPGLSICMGSEVRKKPRDNQAQRAAPPSTDPDERLERRHRSWADQHPDFGQSDSYVTIPR